jgi:hypothetical protein
MNQDEQEYLCDIERLINIIYPGAYTTRIKKVGSKGEVVRFYKAELAERLFQDFGKLAEGKKIPNWIVYGNKKYGQLLMKGMIRGDGSTHEGGITFSTISQNMAFSLSLMMNSNGISNTLKKYPPRVGKSDGVYHRTAYEVRVRNAAYIEKLAEIVKMPIKHQMQEKRYPNVIFEKEGNYYHHIQEIKVEEYEGTVYNLNVDEIHDYVSPCGALKNCHPRDAIALSWLSRKLDLSHDLFEDVMKTREDLTEWFAKLMEEHDLPKVILGKAFKPGVNLVVGSPSILLKNIMEERGHKVEMYDPYIDSVLPNFKPSVFLIGTKHPEFVNFKFPKGSVVIDPWRYIPEDIDGVKVIGIGK